MALFDYESFTRTKFLRGVSPDLRALSLRDRLLELADTYDDIIIVAHSLGGLIAMEACRLVFDNEAGPVTCIAGVFLIGSPRAGSGWAATPLRWYNRELKWLMPKAQKIKELDRYYSTSVHPELVGNRGRKRILLPMLICAGDKDLVVNPFSSLFGHSQDRVLTLSLGHRALAKPTTNDRAQVDWVIDKLMVIAALRVQVRREVKDLASRLPEAVPPRRHVVTELWTDETGTDWVDLYNSVRETSSTDFLPVLDILDVTPGPVDLHISLHRAEALAAVAPQEAEMRILQPLSRPSVGQHTVVGISPVGSEAAHLESRIASALRGARIDAARTLLKAAADEDELASLMAGWLRLITQRDPRRTAPLPPNAPTTGFDEYLS